VLYNYPMWLIKTHWYIYTHCCYNTPLILSQWTGLRKAEKQLLILGASITEPFHDLTYWLLWQCWRLWTNIWNISVLQLKILWVLIGQGNRVNCKGVKIFPKDLYKIMKPPLRALWHLQDHPVWNINISRWSKTINHIHI